MKIMILMLILTSSILAQEYKILNYTIGSSFQFSHSSDFCNLGIFGQTITGLIENNNNKANNGFWVSFKLPSSSNLGTPILISPYNLENNVSLNLVFRWQGIIGATSYIFKLSKNKDFTDIVIEQETKQNYFSLNNLDISSKYYWAVKSKNNIEESAFSPYSTFITSNISNIADNSTTIPYFRLTPNPVESYISIYTKFDKEENVEVSIVDIFGNEYYSKKANFCEFNELINIKYLSSGLYFIKIRTDRSFKIEKFIKL